MSNEQIAKDIIGEHLHGVNPNSGILQPFVTAIKSSLENKDLEIEALKAENKVLNAASIQFIKDNAKEIESLNAKIKIGIKCLVALIHLDQYRAYKGHQVTFQPDIDEAINEAKEIGLI